MMSYDVQELTEKTKILALNTGAELVGFTRAQEIEKGAPMRHKPSDLLNDAKSVITLACGRSLNEDRNYIHNWGPHFTLTYIQLKDEVKWRRKQARSCIEAVQNLLHQRGFKAVTEPHGWSGILSFRMAAYLAGLGVFGKGSFLVHPSLGPLNVLACVATDAILKYGSPLDVDVCGDCVECIRACKYGALRKKADGFVWIKHKCRAYDLIMNPVTLKWTYGCCNSKCVNVCPAGKPDRERNSGMNNDKSGQTGRQSRKD